MNPNEIEMLSSDKNYLKILIQLFIHILKIKPHPT